jgi:hypothetical protein
MELYGSSNITEMEERILTRFPDDLEDFFQNNPEVSIRTAEK